jgi:hypothetical protein
MLTQRKSAATTTATSPRLIQARYRGVCICGRGFSAGDQIEFDPVGRFKRCGKCVKQHPSAKQNFNGQVIPFDSYSGVVQRLKRIDALPRPLAPNVVHEYWNLMQEISTAPESSKSVRKFLQSAARCCSSDDTERYVVSLLEDKQCVHCFEMQRKGELVLMDFPNRKVHCIWCECTSL